MTNFHGAGRRGVKGMIVHCKCSSSIETDVAYMV